MTSNNFGCNSFFIKLNNLAPYYSSKKMVKKSTTPNIIAKPKLCFEVATLIELNWLILTVITFDQLLLPKR